MEWRPDLTLASRDIVLRPYQQGDVDALFAAATESTAEIYPWLEWCRPGYARRESEKWVGEAETRWRRGESYDFVILGSRAEAFLGACSLNQVQPANRLANLGYWVRTSAAGRGVATAAVGRLATFGLSDLGLRRIEIVVALENLASLRVAEKAGARREAVLRNRLCLHGRSRDAVMFSLTPDETPGRAVEP